MALTKVTGELVDIGDLDISNVGSIQLDSIAGDADSNTSITFSGSDVITIATGGSGRLTIGDGALSPVTDNQIDLGTSSLEFKDAFFDGTVTADAFAGPITGDLTGTLQTAAQTNITSLGTLTALTGGTGDLVWDTTTLVVDSSANNVGIGTASPSSVLSVKSDVNNNVNNGILFEAADSTNKLLRLYENSTGECYMGFYQADTQTALIRTNGSSYFNGGNVGIGTASPAKPLHIYSADNQLVRIESSDAYAGIELKDNTSNASPPLISGVGDALVFYQHNGTDYAERMRLHTDGKVGIGTSSPLTPLHVVGANGLLVDTEGNGDGSVYFGGISGTDRSYIARSSDDILFWNVSDGPIRFGANNGERVRILPGGGITFNGDTASANALDDYEEGTWTPVIKGYSGSDTAALTAADPTYTRVGRLVHVSAYIHSIDFSDLGDGTYVVIDGIPFASDADNYAPIVLGYNNTNITGGYVENNGVVFLNNSAGNEYQQQNNDITPSSGSARFMISMTLNLNV